jgi:hypothetical protein
MKQLFFSKFSELNIRARYKFEVSFLILRKALKTSAGSEIYSITIFPKNLFGVRLKLGNFLNWK